MNVTLFVSHLEINCATMQLLCWNDESASSSKAYEQKNSWKLLNFSWSDVGGTCEIHSEKFYLCSILTHMKFLGSDFTTDTNIQCNLKFQFIRTLTFKSTFKVLTLSPVTGHLLLHIERISTNKISTYKHWRTFKKYFRYFITGINVSLKTSDFHTCLVI